MHFLAFLCGAKVDIRITKRSVKAGFDKRTIGLQVMCYFQLILTSIFDIKLSEVGSDAMHLILIHNNPFRFFTVIFIFYWQFNWMY